MAEAPIPLEALRPGSDPTLRDDWFRLLTGPVGAGLVLALFWAGLLGSLGRKGVTYDEMAHLTAGYSYWRFNDYRLDPENGNLPQRLMALPLVLGGDQFRFPPTDSAAWRAADEWALGSQWFHQMGHDQSAMLFRGRAVMGLLAVALGALVWLWSRGLFGPRGAMLSLLLYVLSPIVLANGALMTSDTATALFFLAAVWSLWNVTRRVTVGRILVSGLCLGGLFVSKMSAMLVVPMALTLAVARIWDGRPLPCAIGRPRELARRSHQALAFMAAGLGQLAVVAAVIWGFYGFRYSAFARPDPEHDRFQRRWELVLGKRDPIDLLGQLKLTDTQRAQVAEALRGANALLEPWADEKVVALQAIRRDILAPAQNQQIDRWLAETSGEWPVRLAEYFRRHELLPEAYIYGQTYAWRYSRIRLAFLNGEFNATGEQGFFPYVFLVKTPLTVFGVCALALAAGVQIGRERRRAGSPVPAGVAGPALRDTLPLWALLIIYWAAVLAGHLNIGHRHIMATYPPLFVLAGAAGYWFGAPGRSSRALALALCGLLAGLAGEIGYRFPNYLAYFNVIAGGPAHGYRHLVDSSLDWGQDLPGVKAYLDQHPSLGAKYLSYFGTDSPGYYGISATRLYSAPGQDVPPPLFLLTTTVDRVDATVADVQRQLPSYEVVGYVQGANNQVQIIMLKNPGAMRWIGGTYLISATMLQPVNYVATGPLGPWNQRYEATYRELAQITAPLLDDNPNVRLTRLREHGPAEWQDILTRFEAFRFARLTAFLRQREPDDYINYSVLVYRLTGADVDRALQGPPPELGEDLPRAIQESLQVGGGSR
jgi:hypothetical protein